MDYWRTFSCLVLAVMSFPSVQLTSPPQIRPERVKEIAYKIGERVEIPCIGQGEPAPNYEWTHDGDALVVNGIDIRQKAGQGTLIIPEPIAQHEGVYQCQAKNEFGTAVSVKYMLKKAFLSPFPTVHEPKVHKPVIGDALKLECHPPASYPKGLIYWGEDKQGSKFTPIETNDRVALDYEGNMYFANILASDEKTYVCVCQNHIYRGLVQGDDQTVEPLAFGNLYLANVLPGDALAGASYVCMRQNDIYRGMVKGDDQKIDPLDTGNLYFANVVADDERVGKKYVCIVQNTVIRSLMQGDDQKIDVYVSGTPHFANVELAWNSPTTQVAIKGRMVQMKCIFSGNPTPSTTWIRLDKEMPDHVQLESHGQELRINSVDFDDAGRYQCQGTNQNTRSSLTRDFTLVVEAMPFWIKEPQDIHSSEEEDATFECVAGGAPKTDISWSFNGVDYDANSNENSRRHVVDNVVYFRNLTKTDAQVIQCNASNKHGYIFKNAFLNVLAEPPSFVEAPDSVTKRAEEQDAVLKCRVFGAPKPTIVWKRGNPPTEVTGPRFEIQPEGDLLIKDLTLAENDTYHCVAWNKYDGISAEAVLIVRRKTEITTAPQSQTVNASTDVTFECEAVTDSNEEFRLKYSWLRNGELIDFTREGRLSMNVLDHSLIIRQATVSDTGDYTCKADNGIDSDSLTAPLTVKDRPDPPQNVKIRSCTASRAEVLWSPGNDNNDIVSEFILYYNTTFDAEGTYAEGARVSAGRDSAFMELSPWANYTFHVRAKNGLGLSERSQFTTALCSSPERRPFKNPSNVCVANEDPTKLIIVWDSMPPIDHNGEGFRYEVRYQRDDFSQPEEMKVINDWRENRLEVDNVPAFTPFRFSVQAHNDKGSAPINQKVEMRGFSGEETPDARPANFRLDKHSLNATSARFMWDDVDRSPEVIRGHFKGFRLVFWKSHDPNTRLEEDVILANVELCTVLRGDSRRRRAAGALVDARTHNLWPFSGITAGVQVINGANAGELSDTIQFNTPEGVPGVIPTLRVTERGSHHLKVEWTPPVDPNGILIGYMLGYRAVNSINEAVTNVRVPDPTRTHKKLHDLEEQTTYIIYIWGMTAPGMGDEYFIEATTKAAAAPDPPIISKLEVGPDYVNTSWTPTEKSGDEKNPGSEFYIKYRKVGEEDWEDTKPPEREHNWINVTDLEPGVEYEFVVVAVNGRGDETPSQPDVVVVGRDQDVAGTTAAPIEPTAGAQIQEASVAGWFIALMIILIFLLIILIIVCLIRRNRGGKYPGETVSMAKSGWFIAIMCILIFLLLILLIICLIRKNRGGKYPVHEKEKLAGRDPEKEDEEAAFGEYSPRDNPEKKKSRASLNSEEKPLGESDTDSMAEYYETDPSKFNEDGSFIGQYGGEKKAEDTTSPSALSTFV